MPEIFYQATNIPAMQNRLCGTLDQALSTRSAEIELIEDEMGLIFNRKFNPDLVVYDDQYQNEQGYSPQFCKHLESVSFLCAKHLLSAQSLLVDIGCGKGKFVELLREKGLNAVGYDNTYQGDMPYIRKCFFGVDSHEKGDLLTLRHVLEHVTSPWDFLDAIAAANDHQGLLYIEVPDLDWILLHKAYFDLFHEHVNYFRAIDFMRRYGSAIVHISKSFGGQYLSVIINLDRAKTEPPPSGKPSENEYLQSSFGTLIEHENRAYASFADCEGLVIWGAASKGVIFASKAPRTLQEKINFAIDINPNKHGHFMPISGVEVLDPESGMAKLKPSSLVIIMNPNYAQEIRESLPQNQPCMVLHQ
jgi:hypothetical protein